MSPIKGDDVEMETRLVDESDDVCTSIVRKKSDENMLEIVRYGDAMLPGRGSITYLETDHDCGVFKSGYTDDLKHLRIKRFTCHKPGCPKCLRQWANLQAKATSSYLWAFWHEHKRPLAHWTFSPSLDWITGHSKYVDEEKNAQHLFREMVKDLRRACNEFLSWNNRVMSIVRHRYRKRCPNCGKKFEKEAYCKSCNVPAIWYFSPHLHLITDFHYRKSDTDKYVKWEADNGFILKKIKQIYTLEHLQCTIAYELGHSEWFPDKISPAIRYYAWSSKSHFRSEVTKIKQEVVSTDKAGNKHGFFQVRPNSIKEDEPGHVVIQKQNGVVPWRRDFGKLVPLVETVYITKLQPLGMFVRERWLRFVPPRKQVEKPDDPWFRSIDWCNRFLSEVVPAIHKSKLRGISQLPWYEMSLVNS